MKRIKSNATGLLLLAVMVLLCWVTVPPADQSNADSPVLLTGELLRFNKAVTTAGDNQIIAGQAGHEFLIVTFTVTSCSDTSDSYYLKSGSTELWYTAAMPKTMDQAGIAGYAGIELVPHVGGHFLTETGEDFTINLTDGEDANVMGTYYIVK